MHLHAPNLLDRLLGKRDSDMKSFKKRLNDIPRGLSDAQLTPRVILTMTVWFGVVTGFAETAVWIYKRYVLDLVVHQSNHFYWLIPLTEAVVFGTVGFILVLVARIVPRLVRMQLLVWLLAFLGYVSLRVITNRIHELAWLVLAAGLATVTTRIVSAHPQGFLTLVRRAVVGAAVLIGGLAVAFLAAEGLVERYAVANLPTPENDAPNVLLIVLDTVPAKRLSVYGYDKPTTPNLERFAETGARFDLCISTSPWTLPAHGTMFTSHLPDDMSADWEEPLDSTHPTLAEVLGKHGYITAGFVANEWYGSPVFGLARGFVHYRDPKTWPQQIIDSSFLLSYLVKHTVGPIVNGRLLARKNAAMVNQEFFRWLSSRNEDRPFFAFLNYMDAHGPYLPPKPFDTKFGLYEPKSPWLDGLSVNKYSAKEIEAYTCAYEGCLAYLDQQVGVLLDDLKQRGLLENTLVIVTSDHGEQIGEHGLVNHANSLYSQLVHVPLLISFPERVQAHTMVATPVSLVDLAQTVFDLVAIPQDDRFRGESLARYLNGSHVVSNSSGPLLSEVHPMRGVGSQTPLSRGAMKSIVLGRHHYIKNGDGVEELFDLISDAEEEENLVGLKSSAPVLARVRESLRKFTAAKRRSGRRHETISSGKATP